MRLKGSEKFREKLAYFKGKKIALLPLYTTGMACASLVILLTFYSLPDKLDSIVQDKWMLALLPVAGVLAIGISGFILAFQMWLWRDRLKAKYGQGSYQRVFLFGFGGIVWVLSLVFNVYIPFSSFSPSFWQATGVSFMATRLDAFTNGFAPAIVFIRLALAQVCLVVGFLMFARAIQVFGIDYMAVVYLYFPEESKMQDNEIYSAIRHPTYAAALTVGLGGFFFAFTIYAGIFILILFTGFSLHVHFVEEKELIQRFGNSYKVYMKSVHAFFVKPAKLKAFFHFLRASPSS